MVLNDKSINTPVSLRKAFSFSAAKSSVSLPLGPSIKSQCRNLESATPSRSCEDRAPCCSTLFFSAFGMVQGSVPSIILAPDAASVLRIFSGAEPASIMTDDFFAPSFLSDGSRSAGLRMMAVALSALRTSSGKRLASTNNSALPLR